MKKGKYVQIKTAIPLDYRGRLDKVIEKYHFKSRYQLMQYLVLCFLKVADPQPDEDVVPNDIEEMFEGYQTYTKKDFQGIKRGSML